MTVKPVRTSAARLHPFHGILLGGAFAFFFATLLSDFAYIASYHIQWSNFASWLIIAGLLFSALILLAAVVSLLRPAYRVKAFVIYTVLLLLICALALLNALIHARDAWAVMPTGAVLSGIVMLLAALASWLGFSRFGVGGAA